MNVIRTEAVFCVRAGLTVADAPQRVSTDNFGGKVKPLVIPAKERI